MLRCDNSFSSVAWNLTKRRLRCSVAWRRHLYEPAHAAWQSRPLRPMLRFSTITFRKSQLFFIEGMWYNEWRITTNKEKPQ